MSKEALAKVVQRAISDAGFRRQLSSDPAGALRGFDLTADETSAVRTGDSGRLSTLGIDQRMSKAFALGASSFAATRVVASDLSGGNATLVDDASGVGSRTSIPSDPNANLTADDAGNAATRSAINDDPNGFLAANANASARVGDDWKFTDRAAAGTARVGDDWKYAGGAQGTTAHGSVAPVEGSPEASAADIAASGGRLGTARLDDASAGASGGATAIHDDPNGFLAANADASGSAARANVIHDDPNGFLAANADASGSVTRANVINDDPNGFLAANANVPTGGSAGDGTAYLDESEAYLSKVGYDPAAATKEVTDAHDRGTWSGDDIAGPSDSSSSSDATLADHTDGSSLTP
jgi:hypothetical protein